MPFKSKAQMRLFFAKERRGELPRGTARRWAHHTPNTKKLPEKVASAFMFGFFDEIEKVARRKEEDREDPSGTVGLLLKFMRRVGKKSDPETIMAFRRLAYNVPTNKRPY